LTVDVSPWDMLLAPNLPQRLHGWDGCKLGLSRVPLLIKSQKDSPAIPERRKDARIELRIPVELRQERPDGTNVLRTVTHNISSSGIYVEVDDADFTVGEEIGVELTIPPAEGVSPYPSRASCPARIRRIARLGGPGSSLLENARVGVAAEFLKRLRLSL